MVIRSCIFDLGGTLVDRYSLTTILSLKNAFASISAAITPARASSIASRRPSRSSKERRFSVISRENCENEKNFKNESQKNIEYVFSCKL